MLDTSALTAAKTLPFTREEYGARLARTRAGMAARGIDVLLVSEPENMYYLTGYFTTGYWSTQVLAVPLEGEPVFVVRHLERTAVLGTAWVERLHAYLDSEDPGALIARTLEAEGWAGARLGVEKHSWYLTVRLFERLGALLPRARFVDASYLVNELRIVKSPAEIEYLRAASRAAQAAVEAGIETAEPGRTEADMAIAIFAALVRHGSDRPDLGVIASGERTMLSHGRFTQRVLRPDDRIRLELTGRIAKYNARFMRSLYLGSPSDELRRLSDTLAAGLDEAVARIRPGIPAAEADAAIRARLRAGGVVMTHRTGYSMGILFMPTPLEANRDLVQEATWTLEAGMVFHVLMRGDGIGHSEMILVTDRGAEVLTGLDRRLFVK